MEGSRALRPVANSEAFVRHGALGMESQAFDKPSIYGFVQTRAGLRRVAVIQLRNERVPSVLVSLWLLVEITKVLLCPQSCSHITKTTLQGPGKCAAILLEPSVDTFEEWMESKHESTRLSSWLRTSCLVPWSPFCHLSWLSAHVVTFSSLSGCTFFS